MVIVWASKSPEAVPTRSPTWTRAVNAPLAVLTREYSAAAALSTRKASWTRSKGWKREQAIHRRLPVRNRPGAERQPRMRSAKIAVRWLSVILAGGVVPTPATVRLPGKVLHEVWLKDSPLAPDSVRLQFPGFNQSAGGPLTNVKTLRQLCYRESLLVQDCPLLPRNG